MAVYLKQKELKDPERYRKCGSAAQLSFRLITAKISKHTWESEMTGPGKFCRDLEYREFTWSRTRYSDCVPLWW